MSLPALLLVLGAALAHASWNLVAKRVPATLPFVWAFTALSVATYVPLAAWVVGSGSSIGGTGLAVATVSAALHTGYFLLLQHAYGVGDLSVVYPVARGSGALLAAAGAVLVLGERQTPVFLGGIVLITFGVLVLAGSAGPLRSGSERRGALLALATGGVIACYTLWDGNAVKTLVVPPLLLTWLSDVGRAALLAPAVARDRESLRAVWTLYRRDTFLVAFLSPLAYLLVLSAVTIAPVSGVAAARETSVLFGVLFGASVLGERRFGRRIAAATLIALGLTALTLGRTAA
ncbi:MAG: EamA family transporter [Actinobacteria bacterium]|nr:EamA family transporter [Actinomycetota bacterium]